MTYFRIGLILTFSLLSVQLSHAGNLKFLQKSVLSEFSEDDAASFRAFANEALNTLADQERRDWASDSQKLRGIIRPLATFEQEGLNCRRTRFAIEGQKYSTAAFIFEMCHVDGRWEFRESPLATFKEADWASLSEALNNVLKDKENGKKHKWNSDTTTVNATIEGFEAKQVNGNTCRDAEISISSAANTTSSGRYTFCRSDDDWTRYVP
jgi:surface antigen